MISVEDRVLILEQRLEAHLDQQERLMDQVGRLSDKLDSLAVEIRGAVSAMKWLLPILAATASCIIWVIERVR